MSPPRLLVAAAAALWLGVAYAACAQAPARTPAPGVLDRPPPVAAPARAAPSPQMVAARRAMREACAGDIGSFCADAEAAHGGVMRCLHAHVAQLSPGCASAGQAMREARRAPAAPT